MLDIGNGGIPHFRAASGSHFQTICWKWKKSRKAPFPDFQGHFTNMKAGPGRFDVADARDAVEVEEFSTEYKAFGRARELLQNGDHGGASARDSSGNVLCGVRLQLKFGFFGE